MKHLEELGRFAAIYDDLGEPPTLRVFGEIDMASAPEFEKAAQSAAMRGIPFAIDLSACSYIDSAGLAVLARSRRRNGLIEALVDQDSKIVRILHITGMEQVVPIRYVTSELAQQFQSRPA